MVEFSFSFVVVHANGYNLFPSPLQYTNLSSRQFRRRKAQLRADHDQVVQSPRSASPLDELVGGVNYAGEVEAHDPYLAYAEPEPMEAEGAELAEEEVLFVVHPDENDDWEDVVGSDDEEEESLGTDGFDDLRLYLKSHRLTCNQGDGLLKLLRTRHPNSRYPTSWRRLFRTPRRCITPVVMGQGQFHYFGIEKGIQAYGADCLKGLKEVDLDIGIDGFAIAKSSTHNGWPILGSISNRRLSPFLIAMYVGYEQLKTVDEFLHDFCEESVELAKRGIRLVNDGPLVPFRIRLFTCDTPARSKITATRHFAHKAGCHKCDQRSVHVGTHNYFSTECGNLRTRESFNKRYDIDHHSTDTKWRSSELEQTEIDMVAKFPCDAHD